MKGIEAAFAGRLGSEPQERVSAKGVVWVSFTVAVDGNEEQTTWVRVAAFGDVAQRCVAELRKGSQIYMEGALRLNEWQDKLTAATRHGLDVSARRVEPLGQIGERRPRNGRGGPRPSSEPHEAAAQRDWQAPTDDARSDIQR
jgi:single-strand DNA-binding protein